MGKKRKIGNESKQESAKKPRTTLITIKEFRAQIKTDNVSDAFRLFYKDCLNDSENESIVEYLEAGGSCQEILDILANPDASVPNNIAMGILNFITKYIMIKKKSEEQATFKMYYKFFNSHFDIFKNMVSGTDEEANIATFKLLSNVVLLSPVLANYVFLNLKLKLDRIASLANIKNSMAVRNAFIRFIMAYLVNPKVNTVSLILLNPDLIGFIIAGLRYDASDLVCLFLNTLLTALDKHSLSNKRTVRTKIVVKIFQPQLVTNLMCLYNWVGPESLNDPEATVNKEEKEKVMECLHEFLLFIYTKYGFVNPSKRFILNFYSEKRLEPIVAIVNKMEKPWEHRYVKLFVAKLCSYLVDLAPLLWEKLRVHIENAEDRVSRGKAIEYIPVFLEALQPSCLDYTKKYLQADDFSRVIQQYILPPTLLKMLVDEVNGFKKDPQNVLESLKALQGVVELIISYLDTSRGWYSEEFCRKVLNNLEVTVLDALPTSGVLLERCNVDDGESNLDKIEVVLNILQHYKTCCPYLLEEINLINFLSDIYEDTEQYAKIVVQSVDVFDSFSEDLIQSSTKSFQRILKAVLVYLFDHRTSEARQGVYKIMRQTKVFEDDESEIEVWIDGILALETINLDAVKFLAKKLHNSMKTNKSGKVSRLMQAVYSSASEHQDYLNFVALNWMHRVGKPAEFVKLLLNYPESIDADLLKYIKSWGNGKAKRLSCSLFERMSSLSKAIFKSGDFAIPLGENDPHLLRMIIFYVCNEGISEEGYQICVKTAKALAKTAEILGERLLKDTFDLNAPNNANRFVANLLDEKLTDHMEYRSKLRDYVLKLESKTKPDDNLLKALIKYIQLTAEDGARVFVHFANFKPKRYLANDIFYELLIWGSEPLLETGQMVDKESFKQAVGILAHLNRSDLDTTRLSRFIDVNVRKYPHFLKCIDDDLIDSFLGKANASEQDIDLIVTLFKSGKRSKDFLENLQVKSTNILIPLLRTALDLNLPKEDLLWLYKLLDVKAFLKEPKQDDAVFTNYKILCKVMAMHLPLKQAEKYAGNYVVGDNVELHQIDVLASVLRSNPSLIDGHVDKLIVTFLDLLKKEKFAQAEKATQEILVLLEAADKLTCNLDFAQILLLKGMEKRPYLLQLLLRFLQLVDFALPVAVGLMDQIVAHPNCAHILLSNKGLCKDSLLGIILCLGERYAEVLRKENLGLLLASFGATNSALDLKIFSLLQLYELNAARTQFYSFMPIVWGAGANDIYNLENKERNSHDEIVQVLSGLDMGKVVNTMKSYSLDGDFWDGKAESNEDVYNLNFFLPYFSNLMKTTKIAVLAPKFARSGALSLVLLALSSNSEKIRMASWYVLGKLYESLEKFRTEHKYAVVYSRFIAAVCKGVMKAKNNQISNLAAVYLCRAVIMLASNRNAIYEPVIMYLGAMESIPLNTIPDLQQMLSSPNLEHQLFILDVVCDGLRVETDAWVLFDNNIFVYLMEMFTSHASSTDIKLKLVAIISKATTFPNCFKRVNANYNFINWIGDSIANCSDVRVLEKLLAIYYEVIKSPFINWKLSSCLLGKAIAKFSEFRMDEKVALQFAKCLELVGQKNISLIKRDVLSNALSLIGNERCKYLLEFSVEEEAQRPENTVDFYCKQLTAKYVHSHKNESK